MDFVEIDRRQKELVNKHSLLMRKSIRMRIKSLTFKQRKAAENHIRLRKSTNTKTKVKTKNGSAEAVRVSYPGQVHFVEAGVAGKIKYAPRQILSSLDNPRAVLSDDLMELYADTLLDTSKEIENV